MRDTTHQPRILEGRRRGRYLKIIALFKMLKGALLFLLNKLQELSNGGGTLRATGILALFYCGVLMTEGIGVYMQKRWAEWLMICATATLIPLELRHIWHRFSTHGPLIVPVIILLANCFIVWFLYLVLRREKPELAIKPQQELVETR